MPPAPPTASARLAARVAAGAVVLACMHAAPAAPATEVSLGAGLGLTLAMQPGVRDWLEAEQEFVGDSLPTPDWRTRPGPGVTPAAEVRLRVHPRWTVGVSVETFHAELGNRAIGEAPFFRGYRSRIEQQFTDVAVHVAWWPAPLPGAYVGGRVGRGRGTLSLNGGGILGSDPNVQVHLAGTWQGRTTTWGALAGWQATWMANPRVDVRVGWTARDLGRPDAGAWGNLTGATTGPLRDAAGRALGIDFGGPYASLAFVFVRTVAP